MKNINFPRFVFMLVIMMTSMTLTSQSTLESVILYNSNPVLAEITTNGNVNKIIREEPDYLKGFILKERDYVQFVEQEVKSPVKPVKPSQSYLVETRDFVVVSFESGFATLDDKAIEYLDKAIAELKRQPNSKVLLRTTTNNNDALLTKNRLNSIRTYFKIRGVEPESVIFESLLGVKETDVVEIHYLH